MPDDELTPEQERENYRASALRTLSNGYISNLAAVSFSKPGPGKIPKYGTIFDGLYEKVTDKVPNQEAYEKLWKRAIQSEGGVISKPILLKLATSAVAQAVTRLKINDYLQLMGTDTQVKPEHDGKYMVELGLPEEEMEDLLVKFLNGLTRKKAQIFLAQEDNEDIGGLEEKFCEVNE